MKVDRETAVPKRELIVMLKVAGSLAVVLSLVCGLAGAVDFRGGGIAAAVPLFTLGLWLFFAGMMMLAASAGLDMLNGIREAIMQSTIETRHYGRTRSNKGSLLASKLAAEPATH